MKLDLCKLAYSVTTNTQSPSSCYGRLQQPPQKFNNVKNAFQCLVLGFLQRSINATSIHQLDDEACRQETFEIVLLIVDLDFYMVCTMVVY